jgi:hypothetical protein
MIRRFRHAAAAALALAPLLAAAETPRIELPSPWRGGLRLEYASESRVDATSAAGARERTRFTDSTIVTVVSAGGRGVVQDWSSRNPVFESLEGDEETAASRRALVAALAGFTLRVAVDAEGNVRLENLDVAGERLRPVARRILARDAERSVLRLPEAERAAARLALQPKLDAMAAQANSPARLDPVIGYLPRAYLAYVGAAQVPNRRVERPVEIVLPGGGLVPGRRTTQLVLDPARRNHAIVRWHAVVDRERAAAMPGAPNVEESGFVLIDRRDGVVELFENTRTYGHGAETLVERQRMRRLGGDHEHAWTDAPSAAMAD